MIQLIFENMKIIVLYASLFEYKLAKLIVFVAFWMYKKSRLGWDLNPQPSDPKSDALSITPPSRQEVKYNLRQINFL